MIDISKMVAGTVISNFDETRSGKITVSIPELGVGLREVLYTSPFYSRNNGGFLAIPEPGSEILVFLSGDTNKLYYLATILDFPSELHPKGLKEWEIIGDKYVYTDRSKPQRITFTDPFGNGLTISSRTLKDFISSKVDLNSRAGKRISLSDSPLSDMLLIRNEHGDGIVISSEPSEVHSERSIEIKSKGSQRMVSYQSDISVMVVEGRDLTLENFSTGTNSIRGQEGRKAGNINLRSHTSDINIVSKAQAGRIFLTTPKARIQIQEDGTVLIECDSSLQIKAGGDIRLYADNSISMQAASVNIKTDSDFKVDAGGVASVKSGGVASVDGAAVHLNSGFSQPVTVPSAATPDKTDYDE